ncbi:MAG: NAD(P)H-binding protein [Ignavibacteriaceae bacterium]
MKKIVLIGATGFIGTSLLEELLNRNYDVTAVARNLQNLKKLSNLTLKEADLLKEDITDILKGNDIVISTFNPGWDNPNIYNDSLNGANAILNSVKKAGVKRFIYVGGAGSLELEPGVQLVDSDTFPAEYKQGALAARDFLNILKKEDTPEWTFVSPAIVVLPGNKTGHYRIGTDQPVFDENNESKIFTGDLAAAIADEVENKKFIRKRFTVGY